MPKKFWIVMTWGNNYKGGIQRWPSYPKAFKCAEDIARRLPHTKVYVLEAISYHWIPKWPVEMHMLEHVAGSKWSYTSETITS